MKAAFTTLALTLAAGASAAAVLPRDAGCCFGLTASGGVSGTVSQLSDGQNRVGGASSSGNAARYCLNNGGITDANGRGCILTPPTTQFQCDSGASPTTGFSVSSSGNVAYNGNTQFVACPVNDNGEYNIYTTAPSGQGGCKQITLSTGAACSSASSSAASSSAPASSAPASSASKSVSSAASSSAPASSASASSASAPAPSASAPASSAPASSAPAPSASAPASSASAPSPSASAPAPSASAPAPSASAPAPSASAPAPSASVQTVTSCTTYEVTHSAPAPSMPASSAPASSAPASSAPASSAPASSAPATSAPASSAPKSSAPASSAPSAPASTAKASSSAPASSAPASSAPASSAPASSAPATSPAATKATASASGSACATTLQSGAYQTPHLIVPVNKNSPSTSYGTQYDASINKDNSTIFQFDIPQSYSGKQRNRIEVPSPYKYSTDEKRRVLDRLIWSSSFESFLATKYPNDKRFGLEGCETLVPGMKALIDRSVDYGIKDVIIGMPHRGRLNVLSNVVRKPNESIFSEFAGSQEASDEGSGDVKYHLGMNFERPTPSGKRVQLSLVANPSHLEAEDPVVLGKTRAIQHFNNDEQKHTTAMGVLLHGDAAFAGQGIVYETMGFHNLPAYSTGGTIHIVVNNQIGFTTDPRFSRSTPYCSDIAKAIDAPVFHVNGDDVEAVNFVCQLAADWRADFRTDCVIDIVCYRKQGHNETDQPSFTQPLMYKRIAQQKPQIDIYVDKLLADKTFSKEDIEEHKKWVLGMLNDSFDRSKDYQPTGKEWLTSAWNGFKSPHELKTEVLPHPPTGVDEAVLKQIGDKIGSSPVEFNVHRNLKRILAGRKKTVEEGKNIDWATAEALAFGSLCLEGHHVRVSGQDVERGTFSQRHAVLHDQENEATWTPLANLSKDQAKFTISNSSLSEFGVLGFEYGYSLSSPNALVMWEAQFGDFANNAQVIIDQFIASGEVKWLQRSGLVCSLPHGYDGQGPEHSSGRMERYLQLCNEEPRIFPAEDKLDRQHQDCNMQIAYMTTPANLFHILRRQMNRQFRKPLIIFFSKSLLRHPLARSDLKDFIGDSHFQWIIPEQEHGSFVAPKEEVDRVVLCTGQVFAALHKHREANGLKNTAITRIEQLNPFPWAQLRENLDSYPNAKTIVWCQEEPLNAGAWSFVQPRIETLLNKTEHHNRRHVMYAGRDPSASVATGLKASHVREENGLLEEAFKVTQDKLKGE